MVGITVFICAVDVDIGAAVENPSDDDPGFTTNPDINSIAGAAVDRDNTDDGIVTS